MADTEDKSRPKTGRRLWLRALFALSLALNVLVIAAIAGAAWRHGGPDGASGPRGGLSMLRALDAPDRRAVLRAAREARAPGYDRNAHQAALLEVLRAEVLDVQAFDALLAVRQEASRARVAALTEAWRAQVIAMTPEARAAYAARLAEEGARWREDKATR